MTLNDLLRQLDGVRRSGHDATARCPAHEDRQNSLSVGSGDDGRILLCCHAGCTFEQIVGALGLEARDLMPANGRRSPAAPSNTWAIRDAEGHLIAEHHRVDGPPKRPGEKASKRMWWSRNGSKGLHGMRTADLPLYGAETLKSASPEADVYVVEGEKPADALREHGLIALGTVTKTGHRSGTGARRGRRLVRRPAFLGSSSTTSGAPPCVT